MKQQQASSRMAPGGARVVTVGAAVVAFTVAAGLLLVCGGWAADASGGEAWLRTALRSPLFVYCGLVTAGCVVALAVLCGALWAAGAAGRAGRGQDAHDTRGQDVRDTKDATQRGAVTLEFALVLPIALMIVLVMIQSSLLMGANLCVHYAAFCAARSAIVTVPHNFGDDEPPNVVADLDASAKRLRIKMAAVWAVLPISCTHSDGPSENADSLSDALSAILASAPGGTPPWVRQDMGHRLAYARDHTNVELDLPASQAGAGGGGAGPGGGGAGPARPPHIGVIIPPTSINTTLAPPGGAPGPLVPARGGAYAPGEDLHVRVQHDFYLSVPYAAGIFSKVADGMPLDFGQGQYALTIRAECTLTNEGEQDFVDVESFPKQP